MDGGGRTVRVSGLPGDIPENRLVDKIKIHFLRKRNGGGEISSVSVSKTTPGDAFITFEDSEVAVKLARRGKQMFKLNDSSYEIMVSLHCNKVDPDEVLLHLSVNVDHSKLPGGKQTVLQLHKHFPGVLLTFDPHRDHCTLEGRYTEVQALSSQILESLNLQEQTSAKSSTFMTESKEDYNLALEKKTDHLLKVTEGSGVDQQSEELELEHENTSWRTGITQPSSYTHEASYEASQEEMWGSEAVVENSYEDFSLVIDSDIFHYIHKYCAKEYLNLLRHHRVEVVDMACQDITILYPKPRKGLSEHGMGSVKKAHQALAQLYQEKQSQLRREQVPKSGISKEVLESAIQSLKQRLPMLMIKQDEWNIFLVGSKNDVSDAKQFIIDEKRIRMDRSKDLDFLGTLSQPLSSKQGGFTSSEQTGLLDNFKTTGFTGYRQDTDELFKPTSSYQKSSEEQIHNPSGRNTDRENNLMMSEDIFSIGKKSDISEAAGFQSHLTTVQPCGFDNQGKSTDDTFGSHRFSSLPFLDLGKRPLVNPERISDMTEHTWHVDPNTKLSEDKTSRDPKTKRKDSWKELKMAANFTREMPTGLVDLKSNSDLGGSKDAEDQTIALKVEESILVKERKSTEIGQPQSLPFIKPAMNSHFRANPKFGTEGGKISGLNKMDIQSVIGDVKKSGYVPPSFAEKKTTMMPAYSLESQSFNLSHMDLCGDTSMRPLGLPVTSGSGLRRSNSFSGRASKDRDEHTTLNQSSGPKGQSSEAREVFTVDLPVSLQLWLYLKSFYNPEIDSLTSDLQLKETCEKDKVSLCLRGLNADKVKECHRGLKTLIAAAETDFDSRTLPLSMLGVLDCKDKTLVEACTVLKQSYDKVKIAVKSKYVTILGPKSMCSEVEASLIKLVDKTSNNGTFNPKLITSATQDIVGNQGEGDQRHVLTMHNSPHKNKFTQQANLDSFADHVRNIPGVPGSLEDKSAGLAPLKNGLLDPLHCSFCKAQSKMVGLTACGLNLCPKCQNESHVSCKFCQEEASKGKWGIRGTMSIRESTISIPGFIRDTTLKIIYDIPDGIQGEGHPSPGAPFKGGTFEAFLPHNETTKKLIPLLQKAFSKGRTFVVKTRRWREETGEARVTWGSIPHKTRIEGGTSKNGFPDSSYIKRLTEALKIVGVEE